MRISEDVIVFRYKTKIVNLIGSFVTHAMNGIIFNAKDSLMQYNKNNIHVNVVKHGIKNLTLSKNQY